MGALRVAGAAVDAVSLLSSFSAGCKLSFSGFCIFLEETINPLFVSLITGVNFCSLLRGSSLNASGWVNGLPAGLSVSAGAAEVISILPAISLSAGASFNNRKVINPTPAITINNAAILHQLFADGI